ncbi:MAG: rod shape-determining protein RodA [Clostridiales bacterium]|nr:rod shape-determining protein RodA [Clostridiales bacterium]
MKRVKIVINKKLVKNIDYSLLVLVIVIFIIGVLVISSATNSQIMGLTKQVKMQVVAFILGFIIMLFVMYFDYNTYGEFYKVIYIISILLLLLVYVPGLGVVRNNARSWIDLGVIDIQTSEIAKIGFIIFYAKYLESKVGHLDNIKDLIVPILVASPFILLLLKQPDLGSALVFVAIAIAMLFYARLNYKIIAVGALSLIAILPLSLKFLKPHQLQRIEAFMNPNDPSLPGNYHVMQSKITIGSGEVLGKGLFKGVYHRYDYLPVQETDFIFAVAGEELGFVGGTIIISLYGILLLRLLYLASKAKDNFGSLVIIGVLAMFFFQIVENIGMTMGLMPVTGITLPFLSYGGSSIITSMMAIGLVINVYMRRKRSSFML